MSQDVARVPCPGCGVSGEAPDPGSSRWRCPGCGKRFFLRRCAACARVSFVSGLQGFRTPWACTWCRHRNIDFTQNNDPAEATVAELAEELSRSGPPPEPAAPAEPVAEPVVPGLGPPVPGRRRRRAGGIVLLAATAVLAVLAVFAGLTAPGPGPGSRSGTGAAPGPAAPPPRQGVAGPGGNATAPPAGGGHDTLVSRVNPRAVRVSDARVRSVTLQGVSGQLAITGTRAGPVRLAGNVNWTGQAPSVRTRTNRSTGALTVSIRCATASPCSQNLRLAVPAGTATAVNQPAGRITAADIAGPLALTAVHADIAATALRSPDLTARLTSGHLAASFAAPPRRLALTLSSAQSTVRLPFSVPYGIIQNVGSGYVRDAVPQASGTGHTIIARVHSGELELLPS